MLLQNPLTYFVFGLLFAWVMSYFYSAWHNRRKLAWVARWLEPALHILGSRVSSRWQGTDRLDITLGEGRANLKEVAIVLAVQSRRLFNIFISTLRGGRDSMSFLISLNRTPSPTTHFEIFATKEPPPRNLAIAAENWQVESHPSHASYQVAFKNMAGRESAFRLITLLRDSQFDIRRVSVRPGLPHLFLILNLNQLPQTEAADLLRLLRNLADEVNNAPVDNSGLRPERPLGRRAKDPLNQKFPPPMIKPNLDLHSNGHHNGNSKLPPE